MSNHGERNYLQEQSVPEIVKNSLQIYKNNFLKILVGYVAIVLPWYFLSLAFLRPIGTHASVLAADFAISLIFSLLGTMAITLIVADVCLGIRPQLLRTWKRLTPKSIARYFGTTLLILFVMAVVIAIGWFIISVAFNFYPASLISLLIAVVVSLLIALVLVILTVVTAYYTQVVVLEKRWGYNAIKRSAQLGRGYYWRTFGVIVFMFVVFILGGLFLAVVAVAFLGPSGEIVGYMASLIINPIWAIYVVLMYYDLRVRKEGYDVDALEADLRR